MKIKSILTILSFIIILSSCSYTKNEKEIINSSNNINVETFIKEEQKLSEEDMADIDFFEKIIEEDKNQSIDELLDLILEF